ncbi:MAG: protein kinase [Candidatus Latescibacterota bacterium]|nr:MAG: protein kinase [Candidatus Latescibacterota bacterium]
MTPSDKKTTGQPFLPRYEVLEPLGEGAVATVYKVRTRKDGSIRALKALKPEQTETARGVQRFGDEYRILSTLHHPSLPEIFDYGIADDGRRYLVMELLEGEPLDRYVAGQKGDLWLLLYQMNEALAFVHEHGLLHLDLKPGNVLVRRSHAFGEDERPLAMLIDFGLSYRRESGGEVKLVGTPGYMAPEVIRGEENLTRAADYYSLGVIICELVEGRLPFEGSTHDILQAHLTREVSFERQKVDYAELYPWIEKLMSKEPGERLSAFVEFRRAMSARLGEETAGFERAYALGYIDSLGLVGKEEAWEELRGWAVGLSEALQKRARAAADAVKTPPLKDLERKEKPPAEPVSEILKGPVTDLEERIREDLLTTAAATIPEPAEGPITDVARVIAVSGPPESGKSHLLLELKNELRLRGVNVVALGEESDYQEIVALDDGRKARAPSQAVDPSSIAIDRFVAGWGRLRSLGERGGVVLVVDDYNRMSGEEREFLEYVGKRLGLSIAEGNEGGIFLVTVGKRAALEKALPTLASKEPGFAGIEVPPPSKVDVDAITERFRGQLSGRKEQTSLAVFLQANLESSGALYASLKQAIADGDLQREHGRWHFHEPRGERVAKADSARAYYQGLVAELRDREKELLSWLACNPALLSMEDLSEISGLPSSQIEETIEALKPHRIIELIETQETTRIGIINDQVRDAIYDALDSKTRKRIHKRYIDFLNATPVDSVEFLETMSHHYERLGAPREALVMRIRALRIGRDAKDVFALRRLCEAGIDYVKKLRAQEWKKRKWHLERYFIKQALQAEWMVTNYGGVVKVVEDQFRRRKREIPLSFYYKYATALERTGKIDACWKILKDGKQLLKNKKSETYFLLLLEEAVALYNAGDFSESLARLEMVEPNALAPTVRARLYVTFMHNYENLGSKDEHRISMSEAERISKSANEYEQLLRVRYSRVMTLFNNSRFSDAKREISGSIKSAVKHKAYRSLCSMLFITSAVYYEEGDYAQALRYLDKTIGVAKDTGISDWVYEYTLRYALIFQNLGFYGNAFRSAQSVFRGLSQDYDFQQYFSALLILLDLCINVNSRRAKEYKALLDRVSARVQSKYRLGYYHRLAGDFQYMHSAYDDALEEYDGARRIYGLIGYTDDLARTEIMMAYAWLGKGVLGEAQALLATVEKTVEKMESKDILGESYALALAYYTAGRTDEQAIRRYLGLCESIRADIRDINVAMRMDVGMFKAASVLRDIGKATLFFDRYYTHVKKIVSNLPGAEYVDDYTKKNELTSAVHEFRRLRGKKPGQSLSD